MKKLFTVIVLGSASVLAADQYSSPSCPGYNQGQGYYQNQQDNQGYYQDQQRIDNRPMTTQSGQNTSDQEIAQKVHDSISAGWFSKGYQDVSFDVRNGVVSLRGSVNAQDDRSKIEDSIRKINGVRQVNNQINVKNGSTTSSANTPYGTTNTQNISSDSTAGKNFPQDTAASNEDRQINNKIRERLSNGWFSKTYDTLVIRTNNGVVTITGTVERQDDVQNVGDQVKGIAGVRSVNNQLRVGSR